MRRGIDSENKGLFSSPFQGDLRSSKLLYRSLSNVGFSSGLPVRHIKKPASSGSFNMAEREGFEPSMGYKTHTPLAGERLQPLGHLSTDAKNTEWLDYRKGLSCRESKTELIIAVGNFVFVALVFLLNSLINLFSMHGDFFWCVDTNPVLER